MSNGNEIKSYWEERAKSNKDAVTATTDDIYLRELEIKTFVDAIRGLSLPQGAVVADIGCGDGYSTIHVANRLPEYRFFGVDYSQNMIVNATKRLEIESTLSSRVSFGVGDVLDLTSCFADRLFQCAMTDRCLINLASYEDQKIAFEQISSHIVKGGHYLAIENFVEGHNNMNDLRTSIGLPEIPMRWHNLFFTEDGFLSASRPFFDLLEFRDFTSSYYYATRVIYSKMCQMRGEKPDYLHDIHKLAVNLPLFGQFSPIRLVVLKRR